MKKRVGIIAVLAVATIIIVVMLSFVPSTIDEDIYTEFSVDYGYEILKADYNIDVSEDHTATVTETLRVKYYVASNGITRYLPTNSGEQYSDISVEGDVYFVGSEVDFITVNTGENYTVDSYKRYKYGDEQNYVIKYKIVPPTRTIGNTNYYMNVVPFGWTTSQSDVSLTITFPYEINDIRVYAGRYGTTQTVDYYSLSSDKTTLSMSGLNLDPFCGVTVDAELGRKFNVNFSLPGLLAILVPLVLIIAAVCLKLFAVKDRTVVPVLNATAPKDGDKVIDPAEMGYLIDKNCESKDITALIFFFASKGLIKISGTDGENLTLEKVGEIDESAPLHQKIVFRGLFVRGDMVTTAQLQNTFYPNVASATSDIKSRYHGKLYDHLASSISIVAATFAALIAIMVTILMATRVHVSLLFNGLIVPLILLAVMVIVGFALGRYVFNNKHKLSFNNIIKRCFIAVVVALVVSFVFSYACLGGIFPFYGRLLISLGLGVTGFVCGFINRKSEYYASLMNDITGFKLFLETAEKERLEAMLEENPQYYYDILPYANVLGVSDKWEEKFSMLENIPPPDYYYGPSLFDFMLFNSMMRMSFVSLGSAIISRPSSSSRSGGGGFGGFGGFGGGFGGGGFGGGGGGRR